MQNAGILKKSIINRLTIGNVYIIRCYCNRWYTLQNNMTNRSFWITKDDWNYLNSERSMEACRLVEFYSIRTNVQYV